MPRTTIALVRHGQTDWNVDHRIQGSTDIELNEVGRQQAAAAGHDLSAGRWDALVASPLQRAYETASIIDSVLQLGAPRVESELRERSFGEIEGLTAIERETRFPIGAQVPGLETREQVIKRALAALEQLADEFDGKRLVVVTHGGVIGSLIRQFTEWRLPQPGDQIPNGSQNIVERTGPGQWRLVSYQVEHGAQHPIPLL